MSVRLPVVGGGPRSPAPARPAVARERAASPRPLIGIAGTRLGPAALRFACRLTAELTERGCAVGVLLCDRAAATALQALRTAGAHDVVEVRAEQLPEAALRALHALPPTALAIGIGAELCDHLQPLLAVRVGNEAPAAGHEAELELPLGSEAVASAIGAWLATRWSRLHAVPFPLLEPGSNG